MGGCLSISSTGSNLQALARSKQGALTPGPRCQTLASKGVINAFYEVVYLILDYFLDEDAGLHQRHLKMTLLATQESFHQASAELEGIYSRYKDYLRRVASGNEVDSKVFLQCKRFIGVWNAAMTPSDGSSCKEMLARANLAYTRIVKNQETGLRLPLSEAPFVYRDLFTQVQRAQDLIDLEDAVGIPLPLEALRYLSKNNPGLGVEQKQALKVWIDKANGSWHISPGKIHRGLKALCEHWKVSTACARDKPSALAYLEYHLQKQGLQALSKPSLHHLRWRDQVERKGSITVQGKEIQLDQLLGNHRSGDSTEDRHRVFSIKGSKSQVAVLGLSEATLLIEQAAGQIESVGIPLVKLCKMSASGDCALMDRLESPLIGHNWHSSESELNVKDLPSLVSLAEFLRHMLAKDKTPLVSASDLMFAGDGSLRLFRGIVPGEQFDFDRLVFLAREAAGESFVLFRELLTRSGMEKHPLVPMYRDVVRVALSADSKSTDMIAAEHDISASQPRKTAKKLSEQVVSFRNTCVTEYIRRYTLAEGITSRDVEAYFQEPLLKRYDASIGAGQFWTWNREEVLAEVAAQQGASLRLKG